LARRGYRFIAPTTSTDGPGTDVLAERAATSANPVLPAGEATGKAAAGDRSRGEAIENEHDLPAAHRGLTRALFALIQVMYLNFYLVALFRLGHVEEITGSFLPGRGALAIVAMVIVTAGVGIPLRCYLLSAVGFDYRRLGDKFHRLFLLILPLDQLWAIAPFLLTQQIGVGAAFAATAALLYVPFSERTLIRMAYPNHG
jgi:hypothetical protein